MTSFLTVGIRTRIIHEGNDLVDAILAGIPGTCAGSFEEGDIIVVAESAVATSEGRVIQLEKVIPGNDSVMLGDRYGIDPRLVEVVKRERQASVERFDGKITPTEIASMIFYGRTDPVKNCDTKGHRSVSMTEAMFFSIKCRADSIGQSIRSTANAMLAGQIPSLSQSELLEGSRIAEEMELHRMISSGSLTSSVRKLIHHERDGKEARTVDPDDRGRVADLSCAREEPVRESSTKDQTFSKRAADEVLEKISEDIPHGGGVVYF